MSCTYVGEIVQGPNGPVVRRPELTPRPDRERRRIVLPRRFARTIEKGGAYASGIMGDSMEPALLDNDTVIVSTVLKPKDGDIVTARMKKRNPLLPTADYIVWRYQGNGAAAYLEKDNQRQYGQARGSAEDVTGVVVYVIQRSSRDPNENHFAIENDRAMREAFNVPASFASNGFHHAPTVAKLRTFLDIPESELIDGRLPWGLFRAFAKADQPHVGISTVDTLTVEITPESCVGNLVIAESDRDMIVGVMQRDGLGTGAPGAFWYGSTPGNPPLRIDHGRTLAIVRQVERRSIVAMPSKRIAANKRAAAGTLPPD